MEIPNNDSWLERVEEIVNLLEGSSISELELVEDGIEIIIRRHPELVLSAVQTTSGSTSVASGPVAKRQEQGIAIIAPITGVYYSAASPTTPDFVNIGEFVQVGQVVALIEAMKVFNEIKAEVSGKVIAMVATNGNVVQKGDVMVRVELA